MSVLITIHMTQQNPILRDIRAQLCGPRFEAEINETVDMMIDWIGDLRVCDPIALWCYKVIQPIYNLEAVA